MERWSSPRQNDRSNSSSHSNSKARTMNAFTIPKQSIMRGQRPPVRGDYNNKGYWRGIPVVGSEQGKKDNLERWKRAKAAI